SSARNERDNAMTRVYTAVATAAIAILCASHASAQDFILHPGYIEGTIQVGASTLTYGSISASAYDSSTGQYHNASTQLVLPPGGGTTGTFRLTVEGGFTYSVSAYLYSSNMSVYLPSTSVTVGVGDTATANRIFADWTPGTVHGVVTVTGGTLTGGW